MKRSRLADMPSELLRRGFREGARLRHARVFHPKGLYLTGRLRASGEYEPLFGSGERPVVARLSKGIGAPDGVPDVFGLAFRVLDADNRPWDFALATTGTGMLSRFLITGARGWRSARYGTLLPYRFADGPSVWLFAEPDVDQPAAASLAALTRHLRDHQVGFELTAARIGEPKRPIAELALHAADSDKSNEHHTDYFDPMINRPDSVALVPAAIAHIRELAYSGSRRGRGEEAPMLPH
ncbi:phosphodiesterase [Nocardia donostiensis]|uniref:phosphodiesterase n=1 Tax=Nocardia donostiensis TaxID=1538463 RepID=UPI0009D9838A|nr:phosphodiesterase [Nocardia donostiensis]OQS13101.1 phosphodiesterase [Nocardia donostiensis]